MNELSDCFQSTRGLSEAPAPPKYLDLGRSRSRLPPAPHPGDITPDPKPALEVMGPFQVRAASFPLAPVYREGGYGVLGVRAVGCVRRT